MGMLGPSRRRTRRRFFANCAIGVGLAVAGCRFGGSGTSPFAEVALPDAAPSGGGASSANDTASTNVTGGATNTGGTTDASGAGSTGAGTARDSGAVADGGASSGSAGALGGDPSFDGDALGTGSPGGACQPSPSPLICDPVHNIGCLVPFSFCDIDPTQAVIAGRCVFPFATAAPAADGGASCVSDATTETCLPTSTCVNKTCRKLCYCDGDCAAGQCCAEPAPGSAGAFKLCKPC